ncbi:hypothetical protein MLD38_018630 [Melastoma candidum]|uniref:Uncharacterized protein n=1 Tax=Melastoma candidum TaxID=119954 RepID=A0ACB9QYG6_9MYRT|nr:hypothetical protein MLD38_018630 [Melastoma candidum]
MSQTSGTSPSSSADAFHLQPLRLRCSVPPLRLRHKKTKVAAQPPLIVPPPTNQTPRNCGPVSLAFHLTAIVIRLAAISSEENLPKPRKKSGFTCVVQSYWEAVVCAMDCRNCVAGYGSLGHYFLVHWYVGTPIFGANGWFQQGGPHVYGTGTLQPFDRFHRRLRLKGKWHFDVALGCLMFPVVNRLSQINLDLLPIQPSTPVALSSMEQSILARDPVAMALYAIVVTICAPVWEEIVFRGFLLPSLTRYMPVW